MKTFFPRRSTLAVALAGVALSPIVAAETVGPQIYGRINVSLDQFDYEGATRVIAGRSASRIDEWQLNSNASRLGVRGQFDIGDTGLQAVYQAEYEINVDDGGSGDNSFSQRNIFGGFQGRYGQIIAGKFDTPLKTAEGKIDQFQDLAGDLDALIGGQNRVSDIVQYSTPALFGLPLVVKAAFVPGESRDVDDDGQPDRDIADAYSASITYSGDVLYAALAYDSDQPARRSLDGFTQADAIRAVAGIRWQQLEAGVLLQRSSDVAPGSDREDASYLVSAAYNLKALKLKAQYGFSKGEVTDEEGRLLALGLDYNLSKQSTLYTYWTRLELDKADLTDDAIGFGFAHSF